MAKLVIVDYGMANLRSVQKAFERVGATAEISGDPNRVAEADKLVLPGVGAFRDAIARLHESGLAEPIKAHVKSGKPFLGICLGLQLLFTRSQDRKSTRLNSSHANISYAVFCLKKKKQTTPLIR